MILRFALCIGLLTGTPVLGESFDLRLADPLHPESPAKTHKIDATTDKQGVPVGYRFHLQAQTCFDDVCKPLDVTLKWDAFGRFAGLVLQPNLPLTKKKHTPLSRQDYERLDRILADTESLLGRHPLDFFVQETPRPDPERIDAVTSATPLAVREAVVPEAAYTSWVLWRWVNGPIVEKLQTHTARSSTPEFLKRCLLSRDAGQVRFALETLLGEHPPEGDYETECLRILETAGRANCILALRYLQADTADADALSLRLVPLFGRNGGSSRLIYRHFEKQTAAPPRLWERLAERIADLPDYEQLPLLDLLQQHAPDSAEVRRHISALPAPDDPFVAERVRKFLEK